jgi:hypothetical protein
MKKRRRYFRSQWLSKGLEQEAHAMLETQRGSSLEKSPL